MIWRVTMHREGEKPIIKRYPSLGMIRLIEGLASTRENWDLATEMERRWGGSPFLATRIEIEPDPSCDAAGRADD